MKSVPCTKYLESLERSTKAWADDDWKAFAGEYESALVTAGEGEKGFSTDEGWKKVRDMTVRMRTSATSDSDREFRMRYRALLTYRKDRDRVSEESEAEDEIETKHDRRILPRLPSVTFAGTQGFLEELFKPLALVLGFGNSPIVLFGVGATMLLLAASNTAMTLASAFMQGYVPGRHEVLLSAFNPVDSLLYGIWNLVAVDIIGKLFTHFHLVSKITRGLWLHFKE